MTRGRCSPRPRSTSWVSIARQPSTVTTSGFNSASIALLRPRQPGQVLGEAADRLLGVALVRAEDPGRAALDPADRVDARDRLAVRAEHAAALVRQHVVALVERNVGQRHGAIADRAEHEPALDRLHRVVERPRAQGAVLGAHDRVPLYVDRLDLLFAADRDRRGEEAKVDPPAGVGARPGRELAQQLDVLARGERALLGQPALRHGIELDVARVDDGVDPFEPPELTQLGARERGLGGTAAPEHDDLLDPAGAQRLQRVVRDVGALELVGAQRQDPRHVGGDVPVADHDRAPRRQVELEVAVVGVAVVPGDELGRRPAAGQVLAGDAERLVGLRAGGVDDRRVVLHQLGVGDVDPDLDVPEEAAAAFQRLALEGVLQALDLLVVGRHAAAQQAPRRRQPLEQVDVGGARPQEGGGGEGSRGPGADDRDSRPHHAAVRSAVPASAKNSALSSSA